MPDSKLRLWTDGTVLSVTLIALLSQLLPDGNGLRVVASLVAASLLPGAAVLTRFHVDDLPTWIALAVGISFAFEAVTASAALWSHAWQPAAVILLLAVPAAVVVALDLLACRRAASRPAGGRGSPPGGGASDRDATRRIGGWNTQDTQRVQAWDADTTRRMRHTDTTQQAGHADIPGHDPGPREARGRPGSRDPGGRPPPPPDVHSERTRYGMTYPRPPRRDPGQRDQPGREESGRQERWR